jgi:hypothetical protein
MLWCPKCDAVFCTVEHLEIHLDTPVCQARIVERVLRGVAYV